MKQPAITTAIVIFVLLVVGMATYTYLKHQELQSTVPVATDSTDTSLPSMVDTAIDSDMATADPQPEPEESLPANDAAEPLLLTRSYENGVHIISGQVMAPTPCYRLDQQVQIAESYPEQVTLDLLLVPGGEICAQVLTPLEFMTEVAVAEAASFTVRRNGEQVPFEFVEHSL